jgi:hypothetical protein
MTITNECLEWGGAVSGLIGAFLLATNTKWSKFGWIAFLVANCLIGAYAMGIGARGLLVQQIGFIVTSMLGLYRVRWEFYALNVAALFIRRKITIRTAIYALRKKPVAVCGVGGGYIVAPGFDCGSGN